MVIPKSFVFAVSVVLVTLLSVTDAIPVPAGDGTANSATLATRAMLGVVLDPNPTGDNSQTFQIIQI